MTVRLSVFQSSGKSKFSGQFVTSWLAIRRITRQHAMKNVSCHKDVACHSTHHFRIEISSAAKLRVHTEQCPSYSLYNNYDQAEMPDLFLYFHTFNKPFECRSRVSYKRNCRLRNNFENIRHSCGAGCGAAPPRE